MRTRRRGPRQMPGQVHDHGLRPADRDADLRDRGHPGARRASSDLQRRRLRGETGLVRGHVVAREGVVGPAREEQHGPRRRPRAEVERQRVLLRVAADARAAGSRPRSAGRSRRTASSTSRPRIVRRRRRRARSRTRTSRERAWAARHALVADRPRRPRDGRRRASASRSTNSASSSSLVTRSS